MVVHQALKYFITCLICSINVTSISHWYNKLLWNYYQTLNMKNTWILFREFLLGMDVRDFYFLSLLCIKI